MAPSILIVTPHIGFGQLIQQKLEVIGGYSTMLVGNTAAAVERAISPRTRAVIPVHFAGRPVDLDPLYRLAEDRGRFGLAREALDRALALILEQG